MRRVNTRSNCCSLRRRRRDRGQVHQPRAGVTALTGQAVVGRSVGDRARRVGPDVRLHRRDRQGIRRRESQRHAGHRRERARRRPPRDGRRPGRDDRRLRPLPHHLRDRAARGPRQQLHAEARRPHAADRLSRNDRQCAGATRNARQGAAVQLRRVDPSRGRARRRRWRVRARLDRDARAVEAAREAAARRAAARRRRCCACRTSPTSRIRSSSTARRRDAKARSPRRGQRSRAPAYDWLSRPRCSGERGEPSRTRASGARGGRTKTLVYRLASADTGVLRLRS